MPQILKTKQYQVGHVEGIQHNPFCIGYKDNAGWFIRGISIAFTEGYMETINPVGRHAGSIDRVYQMIQKGE